MNERRRGRKVVRGRGGRNKGDRDSKLREGGSEEERNK